MSGGGLTRVEEMRRNHKETHVWTRSVNSWDVFPVNLAGVPGSCEVGKSRAVGQE